MISAIDLLSKTPSLEEAAHTLSIAVSAWKQGDRRLAVSRGITAAVQAGMASRRTGASEAHVERAEKIIQGVRNLIQGIVVGEALDGFKKKRKYEASLPSQRLPRWASDNPEVAAKGILANSKAAAEIRRRARQELVSHQVEILDAIRQTLLSNPTSAPVGRDSLLIPSPEPLELWEELVGVVPRDQLKVSAIGVEVSAPSRLVASSHLMSALSKGRASEFLDPAIVSMIAAEFERAIQGEFKQRLSQASEAATAEMIRKITGGQ